MEPGIIDQNGLEMSARLRNDLRTAAKWGRIIAIVSIASSAITMLISFSKGKFVSALFTLAISLVIYIYLLKFGNRVSKGIDNDDQESLNSGLQNLMTYFKVCGFLVIIILIILVLAIVFGALGAMIKL